MKPKIPDTYVFLFYIIISFWFLSFFIPSGIYDRCVNITNGIQYVIPGSYHSIAKPAASIFDMFKSIPAGMIDASDIIIFVLMTGGSYGIINATGIINALIGSVVRSCTGKEKLIIPVVMIMFSLAGAIFGTAEEALPLYPIFIKLSLSLGFDSITGVAMILLGAASGFAAGFLNPFTTGIAQDISQLPLFSGIGYRILCYFILLSSSIIYVYRYAVKIQKKQEITLSDCCNPYAEENDIDMGRFRTLNKHHKVESFVLLCYIIFLVYGIMKFKFTTLEISTTFILMGITCGIVGKLKPGRIASEFVKGASSMVYGAMMIGLARSITVIMINGKTLDTIIYMLLKVIEGFPSVLCAVGMFFVHSIINLFIGSGSGQAAATMPIMSILADMSGINRQTAVLAFQFGDGFSNVIYPTIGYFMAALALGGIEWKRWFSWMLPLFFIWCILGSCLVAISVLINYGPF